jgi:hypothetical protein
MPVPRLSKTITRAIRAKRSIIRRIGGYSSTISMWLMKPGTTTMSIAPSPKTR